ncbi:MAG: hypothetical protein R3Y49_01510 [Rikenellaceae bacterium]
MNKIFLILASLLVVSSTFTYAQSSSSANKIPISSVVCSDLDLPEAAREALNMKLLQMSSVNGFGAAGGEFIITANTRIVDKQAMNTAPIQYVIETETSVYVVNLNEKIIAAEISFTTKAIDKTEARAIVKAINAIKPKGPDAIKFMTNARSTIVEYYVDRLPTIISKANSLADQGSFEEAINTLGGVPECIDGYEDVAKLSAEIYLKQIDTEATALLSEAKAKMRTKNYDEAADLLSQINPLSKVFASVDAMLLEIERSIEADKAAEIKAELDKIKENNRHAMELQKENNAYNVELRKASQKRYVYPVTTYSVDRALYKWLFY